VIADGVLQLEATARDAGRFARIAASDLFEPKSLALRDPDEVAARLGEPASGGLEMADALVIEPAVVLRSWLGETRRARIAALQRSDALWRVLGDQGEDLGLFDAVIVAAGIGTTDLAGGAPLTPVRGQASWAALADRPPGAAWGGYAVPTRDGVLFGATHDRGDTGCEVREADHRRNLATLAARRPRLAARVEGAGLDGRAAVRAAAADHLPLAGAVAPGLLVLAGLGGRGFSLAPLLAEHLAGLALGAPSPLMAPLAKLVDPARFRAASPEANS
jgi:tRNA 5-methylaminomethyl-2-thiouridine biosynthesis bifunctional protein